ncbi:DoxX family protein [Serratia sp. TSA_130.2]|uniref:DoxX family protein n=1 Tax=Serratia TaxID=613 RepID=UPI00062822B6|nr:DoxX family protein [Serratia ureilytica]KKO55702.1 putative doxX [Serratia ureilytica]PKR37649.1 DoxX family protein [Serratia ureilytica]HEI9709627.1 DoxX family protein [Serratia marcescens]
MNLTVIAARCAQRLHAPAVRWVLLLAICAAYIQGGLVKALNVEGAIAEMTHFGLQPAALILSGFYRWLGALVLAGFTLMATLMANPFWQFDGAERGQMMNGFFEHLGLAGALLLVAFNDLKERTDG